MARAAGIAGRARVEPRLPVEAPGWQRDCSLFAHIAAHRKRVRHGPRMASCIW